MLEKSGDLWAFPAQYRCVTTNGTLDSANRLVMGAGVALEAKRRYPRLPAKLGKWVTIWGNRPFLCRDEGIISFPTKEDWRQKSSYSLVETSAWRLSILADKFLIESVVLPKPGCGCGGLEWAKVCRILSCILDDRFIVVY